MINRQRIKRRLINRHSRMPRLGVKTRHRTVLQPIKQRLTKRYVLKII
jgi:hypothetical protein